MSRCAYDRGKDPVPDHSHGGCCWKGVCPSSFPAGITPGPPMLKPGEWGHVGGRIKALELEHDRLNDGLEIVRAQQSELADLEREYSAYREALETHGKMLEASNCLRRRGHNFPHNHTKGATLKCQLAPLQARSTRAPASP